MAHRLASPAMQKELTKTHAELLKRLEENEAELKELLPEHLRRYAACVWAQDMCYYCYSNGKWRKVQCVS
jgi:hypothetical protein